MKLVTIKDVAAAAGVSIGAVSKVLHGRGGNIRVSDSTAQRIRDAAKALNFRPNFHARSLRSGKSRSIGLVSNPVTSIASRGAYHAIVVEALMTELNALDYALMLSPETLPLLVSDPLTDGRFDGVVWLDTDPVGDLEWSYYGLPIPTVAINGRMDRQAPRGGWFSTDESAGFDLALEHLVSLGHESVAYMDREETGLSVADHRSAAYEQAVARGGLEPHRADPSLDWIRRKDAPTAVICWNEASADRLRRAALAAGLSVPGDLSILGFDGTPLEAAPWASVSSIVPPVGTLVDHAVTHLLEQIAAPETETMVELLPPMFQDLGTTGPPSRKRSA